LGNNWGNILQISFLPPPIRRIMREDHQLSTPRRHRLPNAQPRVQSPRLLEHRTAFRGWTRNFLIPC
jgi:hypothetical protein